MYRSCNYSFTDLFVAAEKRNPTSQMMQEFGALSHEERNRLVEKLADKAGWITTIRQGTDGKIYLAFEPSLSVVKGES